MVEDALGRLLLFQSLSKIKSLFNLFMPGMENFSFQTTEAVFDFIDKNIGDDKIVLVIDELPYWAEKDEALLSVLQKYILFSLSGYTEWFDNLTDKNVLLLTLDSLYE